MMKPKIYKASFDGSTRIDDKRSTIGFIIQSSDKKVLCKAFRPVDYATSIEVEYKALTELLKTAIGLKVTHIQIQGDCQTVISHLNGPIPAIKTPLYMRKSYDECIALINQFEYCTIKWVKRNKNRRANNLSRQSLKAR